MAVPHHTPRQTWEWGCHVHFHGPWWWWVVLGCSPIYPQEATISFPSGIQVCLRSSKGGGHCLLTSAVLCLPLSLSLFSGWMDGMRCGWLEVRTISVAGDSLMQTQNYCVFTIHSPCPHSNQITGQLTSSSGVECAEWREIDERQGKCQPLCVRVIVYGSL